MKLSLEKKLWVTLGLSVLIGSPSYGMNSQGIEDVTDNLPITGVNIQEFQEEDSDFPSDNPYDCIDFTGGDSFTITAGGVANSFLTAVTPSVEISPGDSTVTRIAKVAANTAGKRGTKAAIKYAGGGIVSNAYGVYTQDQDTQKAEGSVARVLGESVKDTVSSLPGGSYLIDVADSLKAPGTTSLTETVARVVCPATVTKMEGTADEIVGSLAKSVVINYVPFGQEVTQFTGYLGQRYFGTPTLAGGLFKTGMSTWSYFSGTDTQKNTDENQDGKTAEESDEESYEESSEGQ